VRSRGCGRRPPRRSRWPNRGLPVVAARPAMACSPVRGLSDGFAVLQKGRNFSRALERFESRSNPLSGATEPAATPV
jgi:hypothetical protein